MFLFNEEPFQAKAEKHRYFHVKLTFLVQDVKWPCMRTTSSDIGYGLEHMQQSVVVIDFNQNCERWNFPLSEN